MTSTFSLVRLITLRHLKMHRVRVLLTLLGVVFGVATFVFGPSLALSITSAMHAAVGAFGGSADLEVRTGTSDGLSPEVLDTVRSISAGAAPLVQTGGVMLGQTELIAVMGIDPTVEQDFRQYRLVEGTFISRAGEVLLPVGYVVEKGLAIGQSITLLTAGGLRAVTLVGTLAADGMAALNGGDIAFVHIDDGVALRGGSIDSISVKADAGQNVSTLAETLKAALPGLMVESPEGRSASFATIEGILNVLMLMIGLMILSLGCSLVYNTTSVAVAQRRTEIGLLRALGVPAGEVQRLFLAEGAVVGLIGSILGVLAGYALVSVGASADLAPDFAPDLMAPATVITVPPLIVPVAFAAGMLIAMLAAYIPARGASRVDPVEALVPVKADAAVLRFNRRRALMGLAMVIIGLLMVGVFTAPGGNIMISANGMFVVIFGVVLLLPTLLVGLGKLLPGVAQHIFGIAGMLAAGNITRRAGRTVAVATTLLFGSWMALVASSSNFGYGGFIEEYNRTENVWDVILTGAGSNLFRPVIPLPAGLAAEMAARPDVVTMGGERIVKITYNGAQVDVRAMDIAALRSVGGGLMWRNGDADAAYLRLQQASQPAVLLSAFLAESNGLSIGDTIRLDTPQGPIDFEIAGTIINVVEGAPTELALVMDRGLYVRLWNDDRINRLSLRLTPGADVQAVRRELLRTLVMDGVMVISPAEMTATFVDKVDQIGRTSQIMTAMMTGALLLGTANTLLISVLDRRREMGMLRAVGLTGAQITWSVVLETALLVGIIIVVVLPLGVLNNYLNGRMMEGLMGVRFNMSLTETVISLGLMVAAALLAAYFPARFAGRTDVLEALRYE